MKTKTAMQELVEHVEKRMSELNQTNTVENVCRMAFYDVIAHIKADDLFAKEKNQIIEARLSVTGLNHASPTDDNSLQDAENYFTQKYEQ